MNECVEDGQQGLAGEFEMSSIVVQTPHSLFCEIFRHLAGLALQMVLRLLTHLLSQTTGGQGSISELLPETGGRVCAGALSSEPQPLCLTCW